MRRRTTLADDIVLAHVAHALGVGSLEPNDADDLAFPCFAGPPRDAAALTELLRGDAAVASDEISDDDSALSRAVRVLLSRRFERGEPATGRSQFGGAGATANGASGELPDEPAHALDSLREAVQQRLAEVQLDNAVTGVHIAEGRTRPTVAVRAGAVLLAGDCPRLRSVSATLLDPAPAVDAIVGHVATLLNADLTAVTDAREQYAIGKLLRLR